MRSSPIVVVTMSDWVSLPEITATNCPGSVRIGGMSASNGSMIQLYGSPVKAELPDVQFGVRVRPQDSMGSSIVPL